MSKTRRRMKRIKMRNPFATVMAEQTGNGGAGAHSDRRNKRKGNRAQTQRKAVQASQWGE